MSSTTTAWAWGQISQGKISSESAKLVLLMLADEADSRGFFYQSFEAVGRRLSTCARTISRSIVLLQAADLVSTKPNFDSRGRQLPTTVFLRCPRRGDNLSPHSDNLSPPTGMTNCHPPVGGDKLASLVVVKNIQNNNNLKFDKKLLNDVGITQILKAVSRAPADRQQIILDELMGQARSKKIRNFGSWANSVVTADQKSGWAGEHFYADSEAQLRTVSAAVQLDVPQESPKFVPPPPHVLELQKRLHSTKFVKK